MKKNGSTDEEPEGKLVKLPKFGEIRDEDLNPVVAAEMCHLISKIFGGEEPEPLADNIDVPTMDLIQGYRWFAQRWIELVEPMEIPDGDKARLLGSVLGAVYRVEQELLHSLGLETD